jgi:hypothetical protein
MKKYLFILLAAIALVACSDDDEKAPSHEATLRTMQGDYLGELKMDSRVNDALKCSLVGTQVSLSDSLTIAIPLELVAEQMMELDTWYYTMICHAGYATVHAALDSLVTSNGATRLILHPDSICLSFSTSTFQQAPSDSNHEVKLTFSEECSGDYHNGQLRLDLCIEEMRIDNHLMEAFKPITFHYEGSNDVTLTDGRHIRQLSQTLQGRWRVQALTVAYGNGANISNYAYQYKVYTFDGDNFTYESDTNVQEQGRFDVVWHQWGNELHALYLTEGDNLFPDSSYKFEMTDQTLLLLWTENGFERHVLRLLKETE